MSSPNARLSSMVTRARWDISWRRSWQFGSTSISPLLHAPLHAILTPTFPPPMAHSARAALSSRSSPSLLPAFLLSSLSFSACSLITNVSLSPLSGRVCVFACVWLKAYICHAWPCLACMSLQTISSFSPRSYPPSLRCDGDGNLTQHLQKTIRTASRIGRMLGVHRGLRAWSFG